MSNIKSIKKIRIKNQTLWNIAVENDESYIANGIVVHNCRSLLVPITKDEKFTPDKTVSVIDNGDKKNISIDKFIDKNKGTGF